MKSSVLTAGISKEEFITDFNRSVCRYSVKNHYKHHAEDIFFGNVSADGQFTLFYNKKYVRNSWTTVMRGRISEENEKCIIDYRFSKFLAAQIFSIFFIAFSLFLISLLLVVNPIVAFCPVPFLFVGVLGLTLKSPFAKERLLNQIKEIAKISP